MWSDRNNPDDEIPVPWFQNRYADVAGAMTFILGALLLLFGVLLLYGFLSVPLTTKGFLIAIPLIFLTTVSGSVFLWFCDHVSRQRRWAIVATAAISGVFGLMSVVTLLVVSLYLAMFWNRHWLAMSAFSVFALACLILAWLCQKSLSRLRYDVIQHRGFEPILKPDSRPADDRLPPADHG
jgi:hypothetical protein